MESIIESLFYDKYEVHKSTLMSDEQRTASARLGRYYDRIQESMGQSFYDSLYAAITELWDLENLYFFQKGLQLGGQIMLTVLGPEPDC